MSSLNSRLRTELEQWQGRLPRIWKSHFLSVELDFEAVDDAPSLKSSEQIWPQQANSFGPRGAHLFKAFKDLSPDQVRVVVFGNDPYTRIEQATGRSFEQGNLSNWKKDVQDPKVRFSPSLKTLLAAALATTKLGKGFPLVDGRVVFDADEFESTPNSKWGKWSYGRSPTWVSHLALETILVNKLIGLPTPKQIFGFWAKQGILWINRTLTYSKWETDVSKPGHRRSHQRVWAPFTDRVIEVLLENSSKKKPTVFALWGGEAKEIGKLVRKKAKKLKVSSHIQFAEAGHPQRPENFFLAEGKLRNPFDEINERLTGKKIKWV